MEYLSVNVSGPQLYHAGFAERLIALLLEHGIAGNQLQLEITENVLMHDMHRSVKQLHRLRDHGVRIAIDDFGTGYSSMSYLRTLPLDIIKVDRSFVMHLPGDENSAAIAKAIVGLARSLELESVAEGIETPEQGEFMRQIGCERFQGYLYSRPISAEEFAGFWVTHQLPSSL